MSGINERVRRRIALLAGDDLEGVDAEEARRSVGSCPNCRGHWTRVRGCLDVLERVGKQAEPAPMASLWPAIEAQLNRPVVLAPERFNGWVPALSMAAACIALLIAGRNDVPLPQDAVDGSWTAAVFRAPPGAEESFELRGGRGPYDSAWLQGLRLDESQDPMMNFIRSRQDPGDGGTPR